MRRMSKLAAVAGFAPCLAGCSFLYDASDLQVLDAAPDAEVIVDAVASDPQVTSVEPADVDEGQGDGGSRQVVLVIHGANLVEADTQVELVAESGATTAPIVDDAKLEVDVRHDLLAVPVTFPVDPVLADGLRATFAVKVTQVVDGVPYAATLPSAVTVHGLAELEPAADIALTGGVHRYSRIAIPSGLTVTAMAGQGDPIRLRATSSISVMSPISVDAGTPPSAGPAGGEGGAGGGGGITDGDPGKHGSGPGQGDTNGANATFIGDAELPSLADLSRNRSGGGAGGDGKPLGAAGGSGGGGGGSVELIAAGDLVAGDVSARGHDGATPSGGNKGGAGTGGVILLRAGGALTAGTLDVSGGIADATSAGRTRVDAPATPTIASSIPRAPYRGPAFVGAPLIVPDDRTPTLTVIGTESSSFKYTVVHGGEVIGTFTRDLATTSSSFELGASLGDGLNRICLFVVVAGNSAAPATDTQSCIDLAFVRTQ